MNVNWRLILGGQLLSLCITGTAIFSQLLLSGGHQQFPCLQNFINYLLLLLFYSLIRKHHQSYRVLDKPESDLTESLSIDQEGLLVECPGLTVNQESKSDDHTPISIPTNSTKSNEMDIQPQPLTKFGYFLIALFDSQANFLLFLAYRYTSGLSVLLLDSWTIPCVLLCGYLLRNRYNSIFGHYGHGMHIKLLGCIVCIIGLGLLISEDVNTGRLSSDDVTSAWLGNLLTLIGATLYSFSNLMQEYQVKVNENCTDFLLNLGTFGALISGTQMLVLESRDILFNAHWTPMSILYTMLIVVCLFSLYTGTSFFIQRSSAMMFNLSLLTSDFYGALFSVVLLGQQFTLVYWLAFSMVIIGLVIYHWSSSRR